MLVVEETVNVVNRSCNPLGSYLNAQSRSQDAFMLHKKKFNSNAHVDRIENVCNILRNFFGHSPSYFTYRGLGVRANKPFETVKMQDVGRFLSRKSIAEKNQKLYQPLLALENVKVISKNGHLLVHVYC